MCDMYVQVSDENECLKHGILIHICATAENEQN